MVRGSVTGRIAESYLRELFEDNLDLSGIPDHEAGPLLIADVVKLLLAQGDPQYRPRAGQVVLSFMVEEPAPKPDPNGAEGT